jgi:exosome complex RNA-binding protein Rrp4
LLEVKQVLIKKMKYHFIDLMDDIKLILGMNGLIWIYNSTIKLEQEYFSEDLSKIENANKNEVSSLLTTENQ